MFIHSCFKYLLSGNSASQSSVLGMQTRPWYRGSLPSQSPAPWAAASPVSSSAEMGAAAAAGKMEKEAYKPLILFVVDTTTNSSKTFPIPLFEPHRAFNSQPDKAQGKKKNS